MDSAMLEDVRLAFNSLEAQLRDANQMLSKTQAELQVAQLRQASLADECSELRRAVEAGHKATATQVDAVAGHTRCLSELLKAQEDLAALRAEAGEKVRVHAAQVAGLQAEKQALERKLDVLTATSHAEVEGLRAEATAHTAEHTAELEQLHKNYGARLSALEDFKNAALADKAAAESRLESERASWQAALAALAGTRPSEETLKSRLVAARAEADTARRERDELRLALLAAQHGGGTGTGSMGGAGGGGIGGGGGHVSGIGHMGGGGMGGGGMGPHGGMHMQGAGGPGGGVMPHHVGFDQGSGSTGAGGLGGPPGMVPGMLGGGGMRGGFPTAGNMPSNIIGGPGARLGPPGGGMGYGGGVAGVAGGLGPAGGDFPTYQHQQPPPASAFMQGGVSAFMQPRPAQGAGKPAAGTGAGNMGIAGGRAQRGKFGGAAPVQAPPAKQQRR